MRGIVKEDWDVKDILTNDEWLIIRKEVRPSYLNNSVLSFAFDRGEHPFNWQSISNEQEATEFIYKILAASVLSYYDDYDFRTDWNTGTRHEIGSFFGDWDTLSQPSALGDLIDKIFFSNGILSESYYPCSNEEGTYVKFFINHTRDEVKVPTMKNCTLLHIFSQNDIELLITVTASFLNRIKYRTIHYQDRVKALGFDNAQIRFFAGINYLENKQFDKAIAELEVCLSIEEKFALCSSLWLNLAKAKAANCLISWASDASNYSAEELKAVVPLAEVEAAITYLEKAATLKRSNICNWLCAANNVVWHLRDFNRAKSLYKVAFAIIESESEEMLLPKLWAMLNYAKILFDLDYVDEAKVMAESLLSLVEKVLKLYYSKEDYSLSSWERNVPAEILLANCTKWVEFVDDGRYGDYETGSDVLRMLLENNSTEIQVLVQQKVLCD